MMIQNTLAFLAAVLLALSAEERKFCRKWRTPEGKIKLSPRYWYGEERDGWTVFGDGKQVYKLIQFTQWYSDSYYITVSDALKTCESNGAALNWTIEESLLKELVNKLDVKSERDVHKIWTNVLYSKWKGAQEYLNSGKEVRKLDADEDTQHFIARAVARCIIYVNRPCCLRISGGARKMLGEHK
ncbi:hypothetical protein Q1695_008189 [Nippostrongylus brasiliensis]|nr:hypothetical protein Q1695_008189 [Nippostrongylus brasiliensis]